MPKASELKKGSLVLLNSAPHVVENLVVQTPSARGGASLYKIRFRNLVSKQKEDRTLKGDDAFESVHVERREAQFSYVQQDSYVFMDDEDFSEHLVDGDAIEAERPFLTEGLEGVRVVISEDRVLGIELPDVVELDVTECGPSIKGASATARTKPATLSTGHVVQVPEYLEQGETVRVDTRTGEYLSRAQ